MLLKNLILNDNQFAYRLEVSTQTALHVLMDKVEHSMKCKETTMATVLDI